VYHDEPPFDQGPMSMKTGMPTTLGRRRIQHIDANLLLVRGEPSE
jgi:hypothetical protein